MIGIDFSHPQPAPNLRNGTRARTDAVLSNITEKWVNKRLASGTVFLVFVFFVLNVYRAATQSITIDEAYTYLSFVKPPLFQILTTHDANHHVLHSLLCKASTSLFGVSELTLRVPAIAGGILYCLSALWICRLLLGDCWTTLFCLSILTYNPLILDFSSVARGYGLGLGFLFWGVLGLLKRLGENCGDSPWWHLALCGVSLGLSISSVLVFVVPVAASIGMYTILAFSTLTGSYARRMTEVAALAGSALGVALIINVGPVSHATPKNFVIGFGSLFETLTNTLFQFLQHHSSVIGLFNRQIDLTAWLFPTCCVTVLLILAIAAALLWAHTAKWICFARNETLFLSGLLITTVALLVTLHRCVGVPYPVARTAIYFVPLVMLASVAMLRDLSSQPKLRFVWLPFGVLGTLLLVQFAMQLNVTYYSQWRFNAGTREIARFISAQPVTLRRTKVTATWTLVPGLNFYREMYRLTGWEPVEGRNGDTTLESGDYVVFDGGAAVSMPHERLISIFND